MESAKEYRDTAEVQAKKMKSLAKQGEQSKEAQMLRLHREVWQSEWTRLELEREKVEADLEEWRAVLGDRELAKCEVMLCEERKKFAEVVVRPVQVLQYNCKRWLKVRGHPEVDQGHTVSCSELQEKLLSVKQCLNITQSDLQEEYLSLSDELQDTEHICSDKSDVGVAVGVPLDLVEMECPNQELKSSLLEQFSRLDEHYQHILEQLKERHVPVLRSVVLRSVILRARLKAHLHSLAIRKWSLYTTRFFSITPPD